MFRILLLLLACGILAACTEILDINLNESDPQLVVEANLDMNGHAKVDLTYSINFNEENVFPTVESAQVSITDDEGTVHTLLHTGNGHYALEDLSSEPGRSYHLSITTDEESVTSSCSVPALVQFDSLVVAEAENEFGGPGGGMGGGSRYECVVYYQDPANQLNYYRFTVFQNGEYLGAAIFDDRLSNGQYNRNSLFGIALTLSEGDLVEVEMQCISKEIYDYYNSFGNLFGGPTNASTPANPYSNLEGTKLGYFSAHTSELRGYIH